MACRHIKTNGLRCKSPATRGQSFCYFRAKLHTVSACRQVRSDLAPLPEDPAAILLAIAQISAAMLNRPLEGKRAGQFLFGLQIASRHTNHDFHRNQLETVEWVSQSDEGDELAPRLRVCNRLDVCVGCKYAKTCPNYDPENNGQDGDDDDD